MTAPIKIGITGCSGRMGQTVLACVTEQSDMAVSGALERTGHDWVGRVLSDGIVVTDNVQATFDQCDVVVDFTAPAATLAFAEQAVRSETALVVGTTGFNEAQFAQLQDYARNTPILQAGNMSLGVNLLAMLTQQVARTLNEDFDIEIIEAHHNKKVDAPSGTALMLGEAAAAGRNVNLSDVADQARTGITGARTKGDIGFSVIRGGDIVGEHDVLFAGAGERLTLRHVATDRAIFGRGAVQAARWLSQQSAGYYSMKDVLSLA